MNLNSDRPSPGLDIWSEVGAQFCCQLLQGGGKLTPCTSGDLQEKSPVAGAAGLNLHRFFRFSVER